MLRRRVEDWRRRALEASDPRERAASEKLAAHYEALLARLGEGSAAPDRLWRDGRPRGGRLDGPS